MTSAAFAQAAAANPVILLPLASHEDHGPHLPMGDYLLAEILAVQIAEAAEKLGVAAYVAPAMPFGVADYFGASPGGLALSAQNFAAVLADLLDGLLRHGLTRIVILNGHGGNVPVIHEVTLKVLRAHGLVIPSFYVWKVARQLMARRLPEAHFGHGAEPLLSLSLALRGEFVAPAPAPPAAPATMLGLPVAGFGALDFEGITLEAPVEFGQVPRPAIATAWPAANAALGAEIAGALVQVAARFLAHYVQALSAQV